MTYVLNALPELVNAALPLPLALWIEPQRFRQTWVPAWLAGN